ncbi:MAG: hypothetical protein EOO17_03200 [Chloroflexi bacterium]|nr:MAG: hypothetical protein EOO17_03200 [Chloroflexota bacterium]
MSAKQTIAINGRHYDAHTGLAVDEVATTNHTPAPEIHHTNIRLTPEPAKPARSVASANVHSSTQKSQTLNRRSIKRPEPTPKQPTTPTQQSIITPKRILTSRSAPVARHPHISKFAKHPVTALGPKVMDIGPSTHPHVAKAHAISHAKAAAPQQHRAVVTPSAQPIRAHAPATTIPQPVHAVHKPSHVIKSEAIQTAIENTRKHPTAAKKRFLKRHPRVVSIVSATFAIVILGGYFTYLNMPALSVRVAAAQAGINAAYPSYRPDGYSLNGPVAYNQGQVTMKFAANGGPQSYTIKQTKSGWDSAAVLDNYVTPKAGSSYIPYTERGLTIYAYDGNAAWVNGGILYTVEGDAPLSSDQLRRIATSLI